MKTGFLLPGLLVHWGNCFRLDHEGHPFRKSDYQRHEVPNHQPPYLIVEKTNIHKRRLDVWKPLEDNNQSPNTSNQPTPTLKTLTNLRQQQHQDPTPSQRTSYAPTPPSHQHLPHTKLANKLGTKSRPKYQHYPEFSQPQRSTPRLAPTSLGSYTPPKLTAKLPKKILNLPGYPVRRIEERKDVTRNKVNNPLVHSKNGFLSPLPSTFTYSRPPLPVTNPLLIPKLKVEITEEVSSEKPLEGEEQFEDLLFHLDNYYKDDDYIPTNKSKVKPVENIIKPEEEPEVFKLTPPVFPRLQRQDVINALEVMDETLKPLVAVADRVSSSFSLDSTRKQTVEELLDPARQDSDELLDGVAEAVQFTVQQVLEKPKPLIILTALLLSVITGSAIGNTITTLNAATRELDFGPRRPVGECPVGYEVVYIGTKGEVVTVGEIFNVRVKREELNDSEKDEEEEDPDRKGYAYGTSPLSKKAGAQENMESSGELTGKAGYYCKKRIHGTKDVEGGKGGVGIRVNSDPSDESGGVSITVGGVSVTVGGENGVITAARDGDTDPVTYIQETNTHHQLEQGRYKGEQLAEESDEEEQEKEEDVEEEENGGVFDGIKIALIDSLRQIRSLLTG